MAWSFLPLKRSEYRSDTVVGEVVGVGGWIGEGCWRWLVIGGEVVRQLVIEVVRQLVREDN